MADNYPHLINRRCSLAILAGATATMCLPSAYAQATTDRPFRILVPFNAGGGIDVMARAIAMPLSQRLSLPVVVENKPGASGMIAVDAAAKSEANGYTLVLGQSGPLLTNKFLYAKMPYDPQRDLTLVAQVADAPLVLVVHRDVPADTVPELFRYMAANKGALAYGSWGLGTYPHLAGYYMSAVHKAEMVHSVYKGEAPMLQDMAGGRIQMAFASAMSAKPLLAAGKLKVLAVSGTQRMSALPNAPTFAEQGVKDSVYETVGFIGFAVPSKTPKAVVDHLSTEIQAVCNMPVVSQRIADMGFTMHTGTPQAFVDRYHADYPIYQRLVQQSGATLD